MNKTGIVFLIPNHIGDDSFHNNFPEYNREIMNRLTYFIVENIRTARRFLKGNGYPFPFDQTTFVELDKHNNYSTHTDIFNPVLEGIDAGIISEAGMPCIADPGSQVVLKAHKLGIRVVPLIGPSSVFLSLSASGFNGQSFAFHGYLPVKKEERERKLREIEKSIYKNNQTQIFIETPYRNGHMFDSIIRTCHPATLLCIASQITGPGESVHTFPVSEWKRRGFRAGKTPAVFLIYHE